jgi:hypothetical protein
MIFKREKILWWVVSLLVVLNATIIITIMYRNSQVQILERTIVVETGTASMSRQHLCQILDLCARQKCQFCPKHTAFKAETDRIIWQIDEEKHLLFKEMQKCCPNADELNRRSENIGNLHTELKKITVDFYRTIYEICCTQEQREKLRQVFEPLFERISHGGQPPACQ